MRALPLWLAAAWWGSLTTLGFFVVPMLFAFLPTPAMAGGMAAKLFTAQTFISAICGLLLLANLWSKRAQGRMDKAQAAIIFVAIGVALALIVELWVAPKIVARDNLALWHRAGSVMYLMQWLCACVVFGKLAGQSRA
jgi:hypothetical protein